MVAHGRLWLGVAETVAGTLQHDALQAGIAFPAGLLFLGSWVGTVRRCMVAFI